MFSYDGMSSVTYAYGEPPIFCPGCSSDNTVRWYSRYEQPLLLVLSLNICCASALMQGNVQSKDLGKAVSGHHIVIH
jgi:hypothetical protein